MVSYKFVQHRVLSDHVLYLSCLGPDLHPNVRGLSPRGDVQTRTTLWSWSGNSLSQWTRNTSTDSWRRPQVRATAAAAKRWRGWWTLGRQYGFHGRPLSPSPIYRHVCLSTTNGCWDAFNSCQRDECAWEWTHEWKCRLLVPSSLIYYDLLVQFSGALALLAMNGTNGKINKKSWYFFERLCWSLLLSLAMCFVEGIDESWFKFCVRIVRCYHPSLHAVAEQKICCSKGCRAWIMWLHWVQTV